MYSSQQLNRLKYKGKSAYNDVYFVKTRVNSRIQNRRGISNRLNQIKYEIDDVEKELDRLSSFLAYAVNEYSGCDDRISRETLRLYDENNEKVGSIISLLSCVSVTSVNKLVGVNQHIVGNSKLYCMWQGIVIKREDTSNEEKLIIGMSDSRLGHLGWFAPWWDKVKHFWDYVNNNNSQEEYGPRVEVDNESNLDQEISDKNGISEDGVNIRKEGFYHNENKKNSEDSNESSIFPPYTQGYVNERVSHFSEEYEDNVIKFIEEYEKNNPKLAELQKDILLSQILEKISNDKDLYYNYIQNDSDEPLIMFFEGAVDTKEGFKNADADAEYHADGRYKAMTVVISNGKIQYLTTNASTLPDYPDSNSGKGTSTLNEGTFRFFSGLHKGQYPALRVTQVSNQTKDWSSTPVPVTRGEDNTSSSAGDINVHMGYSTTRSSDGCLTIHHSDYDEFSRAVGYNGSRTRVTYNNHSQDYIKMEGFIVVDRSNV